MQQTAFGARDRCFFSVFVCGAPRRRLMRKPLGRFLLLSQSHISLDRWYNFCYTEAMKTAISLPDPLFQAAEQFAQEQGWSRSELYVRALQAYLQAHRYHGITDALDQIYSTETSNLDPAVTAAQARILPQDKW
jgi:hypothetical protein